MLLWCPFPTVPMPSEVGRSAPEAVRNRLPALVGSESGLSASDHPGWLCSQGGHWHFQPDSEARQGGEHSDESAPAAGHWGW